MSRLRLHAGGRARRRAGFIGPGSGPELAGSVRVANRTQVNGGRWLLAATLTASVGCYVSAPIKPSELVLLDGYQDGAPRGGSVSLLSPANRPVEVAQNAQIFLDVPAGTRGGTFKTIRVSDGILRGVTQEGESVLVPLSSVQAARVREPNPGLWVLVGVGIAASALWAGFYFVRQTHGEAEPSAIR